MRLHLVASILSLSVVCSARANDASFYGEGSTVFAYKEHRVRMVSENIRIRWDPQPNRGGIWVADCTFEFENLSDEALTIQMGFPDQTAFPAGLWTINHFETRVGGQPVESTHKTVHAPRHQTPQLMGQLGQSQPTKAQKRPPPDPETATWRAMAKAAQKAMNISFGAAYTWKVTFAPRGRVTVENRYRFGGGSTNGPVDLCMDEKRPSIGHSWHASPSTSGLGEGPCSVVTYVVTTGKTWLAPISKAIIEIDIRPGTPANHVIPFPPATEVTDKTVKWAFEDFRPTEELRVVFAVSLAEHDQGWGDTIDFTTPAQVKEWLLFAKANGFTAEALSQMHTAQAYSFGIRKKEATPSVFGRHTPPKVDKARKASELTADEREILQLLERAAKGAKPRSSKAAKKVP